MFSKKKTGAPAADNHSVMRGRDSAAAKTGDNPLARRFHPDDEPETIDLENPGGFHSADHEADPPTAQLGGEGADAAGMPGDESARARAVISLDERSGKFYLHPGSGGHEVRLGGVVVGSVSELRPGDRIAIGDHAFQFNPEPIED
jgi:hypothetical protein